MLSTLLFALSCAVASAVAAPFQAEALGPGGTLIVVDPKITSPTASTVWVVGNKYNVTWDNSSLPPLVNITNVEGQVILGQLNGDGEKLYTDSPLAQGFLITDSEVEITVPQVPDGKYMIVLLGDSGNQSPQFQIVNNPLSTILTPQNTPSSGPSSNAASTPAASPSSSAMNSAAAAAPSGSSPTAASLTARPASSSSSPAVIPIPASITASGVSQSTGPSAPAPTGNGARSWASINFASIGCAIAAVSAVLAF